MFSRKNDGDVKISAKKDQTVSQLIEMLQVVEKNGKGDSVVKIHGRPVKGFTVSAHHGTFDIR